MQNKCFQFGLVQNFIVWELVKSPQTPAEIFSLPIEGLILSYSMSVGFSGLHVSWSR